VLNVKILKYLICRAVLQGEALRAQSWPDDDLPRGSLLAFVTDAFVAFKDLPGLQCIDLDSTVEFTTSEVGRDFVICAVHQARVTFHGAAVADARPLPGSADWTYGLIPAHGLGEGGYSIRRTDENVQASLALDDSEQRRFFELVEDQEHRMRYAFNRVQVCHAVADDIGPDTRRAD
jgi:hypothetical protein